MNILFKNGKYVISDQHDQVVAIGHEDYGLYKLDVNNIILDSSYSITQSLLKMQLWHQCLGHLNLDNLKMMVNKNMVLGF